ncbi:MAG: Nif3-like dinuclear metal center hexameric protein [Thermodesulfobacteriota bacterium]
MSTLYKTVEFLDTYLDIFAIQDSCWNGLQFEGNKDVKKIAYAVDAGIETFNKAASLKCDMIVVHHGHFWSHQNPSYKDWGKKRLDVLYNNEISLYACHLPLDRHRVVGNNAQIIRLLGGIVNQEFLFHSGKNIGWTGKLKTQQTINQIVKTLKTKLNSDPKVLSFGKKKIKTIAVCSGGGGYGGFYEALSEGADLYITGDAIEIFYTAKDSEMNVIFAGHHATETIGLQALKKVVDKKFRTESVFIDLPTGL